MDERHPITYDCCYSCNFRFCFFIFIFCSLLIIAAVLSRKRLQLFFWPLFHCYKRHQPMQYNNIVKEDMFHKKQCILLFEFFDDVAVVVCARFACTQIVV